jgi:hypothetical protein
MRNIVRSTNVKPSSIKLKQKTYVIVILHVDALLYYKSMNQNAPIVFIKRESRIESETTKNGRMKPCVWIVEEY